MTDKIVPAALKYWLIILLVLVFLRYSVATSIVFGAVGGFAAAWVSVWWGAKGGEPTSPPIAERVDRVRNRLRETRSKLPLKRFMLWRRQ